MYSSGYSQVSKGRPQAQKKMQYRSKSKSCGYYLRIIFFFSSLIQSLIIVSLVLFLVYGKTQDSASTTRIQDLEESFSRLSIENVALRQQRRNLTTLLNVTLTEKTRNDWDLLRIRRLSNISVTFIQDLDKKLQETNLELVMCRNQARLQQNCLRPQLATVSQIGGCNCNLQMERVTSKLELVESNFTQTIQKMRMDMDQITKDRDNFNLEAIRLRREKTLHLKEIEFCIQSSKEDFVQSLSGLSNVSRAFLLKIESLFPEHIAFQVTCEKQREHLEQIRTNCTSLSRAVEDRFQRYLNNVGDKMSEIQSQNSRLKAENLRRSDDYRVCSQNRSGLIIEHRQTLEKLQMKYDKDYEGLLLEKSRLSRDIEVLEKDINYKNKDIQYLTEQLRQLNISCIAKIGLGGLPGTGMGQLGRGGSSNFGSTALNPSLGSTGSGLNRLGSTALGSSNSGSTALNPSLGSTGSGLNRLGSTGLGSSNPSSTGSGLNKYGSTGLGSSLGSVGSRLNKPVSPVSRSSGTGSTGLGLNKPGSTLLGSSSGLNKPGSTGLGSSGLGAAGSGINKPVSTASGSYGFGSTGSGINKPGSTGLGTSGLGSAGSGINKPGSTMLGSSSLGSNGTALTKPGSTGLGSSSLGTTGSRLNRLGSTGLGSSTLGSIGSALNKPGSTVLGSSGLGSTGSGLNKPSSTGLGSSGLGSTGSGLNSQGSTGLGTSSLSSTGSNKSTSSLKSSGPGSSGSSSSVFSWFGLAPSNSNTGQSKPGSGTGRGTSSGSSVGTGRTGGLGGGSLSVAQHLEALQRIINPSYSNEERQELSRMMG
ncbi:plasmalemma vesicle associated protein a isoform X1 [Syngnathoides biaculeatus]|uniref:plasmalemma vesicle associated protein a isoform X1 n=2 Tax=Syngnathoides biaculeatus TaxID=300417 RepID=UPI002ADD8626|nr:plasmalemma vesicle associated protein a isoform X1 [Syngnathoides biaculeatus]